MKNRNYFDWVNNLFVGLMLVLAFVVWCIFAILYPESDTVTVYSLDRSVPKTSDIMTNSGNTIGIQRLQAEIILLDYCVIPHLYDFLQNLQNNPQGNQNPYDFIQSNQPSGSSRGDIWKQTYFKSWYRHTAPGTNVVLNDFNLPYGTVGNLYTNTVGDPNLPPQHFLPMCRCFDAVLTKFGSYPDSALAAQQPRAASAMTSCMRTRQLIPRQNFESGSIINGNVSNTKSISRSGFLLMMGLALLLNLLYRRWTLAGPEGGGFWERLLFSKLNKVFIIVLLFLIIFLPAVYFSSKSWDYIRYTAPLTLVGFLLLTIVEIAWLNQPNFYDDLKRHTYLHPFTFYITLTSLYMLALIENGVFTDENIFTYIWTSLGISCLYAGVVLCENRQLWRKEYGETCRTGYLLYIFLAGLLVAVRLVPYFPVSCELNFLWILPMCFAAFCFAGVVFVEHIVNEDVKPHDKEGTLALFNETAHYMQLGHLAVLMLVTFYFLSVMVGLAMNDKLLLNANSQMNKLNFEVFQLSPSNSYFEF